jgi:hypothetical protein
MEKNPRSLRITLLLALCLFGALVYYTAQDRNDQQAGYHAEIAYGMDVELRWIVEADQADRQVVQDTLSFYAGMLGQYAGAQSSRFELGHCCDDAALQASFTDHADFYHLRASLDFAAPDAHASLMSHLIAQGYVQPGAYRYQYGLGRGELALHLPVPGHAGQVLHISGSAFELQMAPRVATAGVAGPDEA